ncbi:hypothetical protein ACFWCF_01275 [Rhodococcus sp. NPDC060090]|uniref:hypothetical protein n=1 Tax=Rhodococcus sp. NPDC060090 TaxID=3347056 RepID=UPI00364B0B3F
MLDLTACHPTRLQIIDHVCSRLLNHAGHLQPSDLMILGAQCRDVLHEALGHSFPLRTTQDLDVALAIANWDAYREIVTDLPAIGGTGIRYDVGGVPTDLVPFGPIENPTGVVPDPPDRSLSVWAFREVFDTGYDLPLPTVGSTRIPTVPGYTALKLAAWLDRSENGLYKDAPDIATAVYWYTSSKAVKNRLYEDSGHGMDVLDKFEFDENRALAYLLGEDVAATVGSQRLDELATRWPGPHDDALVQHMNIDTAPLVWSPDIHRRKELIDALALGLSENAWS